MKIERQSQQWPHRVAGLYRHAVEMPPTEPSLSAPTPFPAAPDKSQYEHWPGLVNTIRDIGGRWREDPVTLADGSQTNVYLDLKSVLSKGHHMNAASKAMLEHANALGLDYNAVGGPTMGADMVSHGMAAHNPDLDWFAVRSAPKTTHGLGKWIEGAEIGPDHKVLLTDDVANTGKSLVDAYHKIRESGSQVAAVMPIVDRGDKTRKQFEAMGVPYHPLMSYDDLGINTLTQQQGRQAGRSRPFDRAPQRGYRSFRCRLAMPQPTTLQLSNEQPSYSGSHGMKVYEDPQGQWTLKQPKPSLAFTAPLEAAAANLQRKMGLEAPESYMIDHQGSPAVVSKWYPGSSQAFQSPPRLGDLHPDDLMTIQKNHALDWLIGNHDSHVGNWLRTQDGKLVSIDKGQAAKYFGHDRLDPYFHPNYYAREPIYNQLHRDHADGYGTLNDPRSGELGNFIKQVQAIPDDELKGMFRPYAQAAAKSGLLLSPDGDPSRDLGHPTVPPNDPEAFLSALVSRKRRLHRDLGEYYDRMSSGREIVGSRRYAGGTAIPTARGPRRVFNAPDIATMLGVTTATMANWMRKHPDRVPSPTHQIGGRPHWDNIDPWHDWMRVRPRPGRPRKDPAVLPLQNGLDGPAGGTIPYSVVAPLGQENVPQKRPTLKVDPADEYMNWADLDNGLDANVLLRSLHSTGGPGAAGDILPRQARRRR